MYRGLVDVLHSLRCVACVNVHEVFHDVLGCVWMYGIVSRLVKFHSVFEDVSICAVLS